MPVISLRNTATSKIDYSQLSIAQKENGTYSKETHEVQQVQNPAPEKSPYIIHAEQQLWQPGPELYGKHYLEHQPTVHLHHK